jgi:uncharacterized phage protein gp47/JayE
VTDYGVTPTGFVPKPLEAIVEDLVTQQRATISPSLNTGPKSVVGMMNMIFGTALAKGWEMGAADYRARDPRSASADALDGVSAITGTKRAAATKGTVPLTLTVAPLHTINAGAVAGIQGQPGNLWVTQAPATNASTSLPASITVPAVAQTAGVFPANAGTITVIASPTDGWLDVTNPTDAVPGTAVEGDPALRVRRVLELARAGGTNIASLRTALLSLRSATGNIVVVSAFVDENTSAWSDSLGRPPHCVEAVVQFGPGYSDPDGPGLFLAALWAGKSGGIPLYGTSSGTIVDSEGITRTVSWSVPAQVLVYVATTIAVDAAQYDPGPSNDDAPMKAAIKAFGDALAIGQSVVWSRLNCVIVDQPGVTDVASLGIGLGTDGLRQQNITIGPRQLAVFDTSRITVTR